MDKIRIALADDHTIVRRGIAAMLDADKDFTVVADAPNGKALLEALAGIRPPAHVCLLDVNMPEMNGYETLVALKEKYPEMRFLILTQLEHEYIIVRMLKAGASGYMLKDAEPGELKVAIRTIMSEPFYTSKLVNGQLISLVRKGRSYDRLALTDREQEFLKLSCSEMPYKEIAAKMNISERTAAFYRQSLFEKLDIKSRTGLALYALKLGLVPMDEM